MKKLSTMSWNAETLRKTHGIAFIVWVLLLIPTCLWWRDSIFWISFMSIYAVISTHASAWQASRAEVSVEEHDK